MPDIWIDVDTAITVPVNVAPLVDDTDFKSIEEAVAYNAAGMDLNWNFVTSAGVMTQTNVVPTTAGLHDWANVGNGMYKIEIPASGGTINNDTEGYGWFSGVCTGVLPWIGPRIGFRAAALNDALCDGGDNLDVNAVQISGDSVAADDLELLVENAKGTDHKVLLSTDAQTGVTIPTVTALTGHTAQTGDTYGALPANFSDLAITVTTGKVTVGTNDDKTGYSISGTITTLDGLNDPTAAVIADAIWDEATTGHVTVGTFGEQCKTDVDAILADSNELQTNQGNWVTATGFSTHDAADVKTAMEASGSLLDWLRDVAEGDVKIEGTSPFELKIYTKDTTTGALITKYLYQKDSTAVSSTDHVVGQQTESTL